MSDELDPDGGPSTGVNRPQRPTGKRSREREGGTALAEIDTEEALTEQFEAVDKADKKARKAARKVSAKKDAGEPSRNPFAFVVTYLKQVVAEMRKVIWPNRKEMVSYTSIVLVFLVFMVSLIFGTDMGFAKLVIWLLG